MKYKLIAIDLDGTLLNDNLSIPEQNFKAVKEAVNSGVHIILSSGRSYSSLRYFAQQLNLISDKNFVISFNGCVIHKTGSNEIIRNIKLPKKTALDILGKVPKDKIEIVVYWDIYGIYAGENKKYTNKYLDICKAIPTYISNFENDMTDEVYKVLLLGDNDILKVIEKDFSAEGVNDFYNMFFSGYHLLEFNHRSATKGTGLQFLCDYLNIDIKDTIAIGDSGNDISMLQTAGLGVAMKNADDDIKSAADYITERDNNTCGVAEVINKFIFGLEGGRYI